MLSIDSIGDWCDMSCRSEAQSPAQPGPLHIVVDVLAGHGLLHHFLHTEGHVSGGVEVFGAGVEGALGVLPLLDLIDLGSAAVTSLFLSGSATLTICPKEGMTVMLMLLRGQLFTRLQLWCSGTT